jgi:hypothetical protein
MSGYFQRMVQLARHGPVPLRRERSALTLPRPAPPGAEMAAMPDHAADGDGGQARLTKPTAPTVPLGTGITDAPAPTEAARPPPREADDPSAIRPPDHQPALAGLPRPHGRAAGPFDATPIAVRHTTAPDSTAAPHQAIARSSTIAPVSPAPIPAAPRPAAAAHSERPGAPGQHSLTEAATGPPIHVAIPAPPRAGLISAALPQPGVEVNIGAISLELAPEHQSAPAPPAPRPARAWPRSGIWSGTRNLTRNYVRRG